MTSVMDPPAPAAPAPPASQHHASSGPRPWKTAVLIIGALITVVMIGNGTFWIVSSIAHSTESTDVRFEGDIRRVVVRGSHGDIRIRGVDRPDVGGRRTISRGLQSPSITERVDGDTLTLESRCPAVANHCGVSYVIDVPRSAAVDVDHAAGTTRLSGLQNDVKLETGAGEATLEDVSGPISIHAGAGSVRASNLRSKSVAVDGAAGEVRLDFVDSPDQITAELGAGEIEIVVPNDGTAYQVRTDKAFGEAKVGVPTNPRSSHSIVVETGAGSIRIATR